MTGDLRPRVVPRQARQSQPLRSSAKKKENSVTYGNGREDVWLWQRTIKNEAWRSWSDK